MELCDFAAGCIGGSAGIFVGHPLDTIKVRLQTSPYPSLWSCVRHIYSSSGVRGYFRGLSFPFVSSGVSNCLFFGIYGHTCRWLGEEPDAHARLGSSTTASSRYWTFFAAGCLAGTVQLVLIVPVEVVKVRMQILDVIHPSTCRSGRKRAGSVQLFRQLVRTGGIGACYRGLVIQAWRDIPSSGLYVLTYEWLTGALMASDRSTASSLDIILAGGIAGALSWLVIAPLDVLKSRLQGDSLDAQSRRYAGIVDCVRKTASEGLSVFFRGVGPVLLRAFPTNAVTFLLYSWSLRMCHSEPSAKAEARIAL